MIDYADMDYVKKLEDRLSFLEELADVSPNPEPAKWYDNIPEGGVLCWANIRGAEITNIKSYSKNRELNKFLDCRSYWWSAPIPLTKQEIQVFMDNAPDEN